MKTQQQNVAEYGNGEAKWPMLWNRGPNGLEYSFIQLHVVERAEQKEKWKDTLTIDPDWQKYPKGYRVLRVEG